MLNQAVFSLFALTCLPIASAAEMTQMAQLVDVNVILYSVLLLVDVGGWIWIGIDLLTRE